MKLKLAIATLPFLFGCATQQALMTDTQSGYPETIFEGASLQDVQNLLIGRCSQLGGMVTDTNSNTVVCSRTLEGQQAVLAQLLLGNSYSTTPVDRIRFILDSNGSSVHVTAYESVETTMPFGQVNRAELKSNNARNALQAGLDRLNREYEYAHPKKPVAVAVGATMPVTANVCTSYDEAGPGNIVKHYHKGDSLTVFERSTIYLRVSANGAPQEWIVDGACSR
ncbi:hypothetical protein [Paraburkholderia sediminicola]|uniref:hypothetical protein n=1 Tax=Paraburkholderia sediminicola TaxID=458836 RepID=UPI0038B909F6